MTFSTLWTSSTFSTFKRKSMKSWKISGWNWREMLPNNRKAFSYILVSLKTRNFRLYFSGMCVSLTGTWMQQIAMSWLVYELTGSVLLLATITFVAQIPILIATPFMSVFVDRFDRHRILLLTQSLSAFQALLLAWLTLSGQVQVWHLMVLSLLIGLINALDNPTRQAFYPSLVAKENLSNAIALNSAVINGSRLIGPAVGGVLIGLLGEGVCFLINGLSYLGVIIALLLMKLPPYQAKTQKQHILQDLKEGFIYVSHHIPIRALLMLMSVISFFGLPLMTFLPAYVKDILHGSSEMLGLLLSCIGIGSFSAAIYLAARKSVIGLAKIIMAAALLLGITLICISFTRFALLAALICIPAGFALIITVASVNTLLQTLSDEDKRGRVMGYLAMTFTGIAPVGSMLLGTLEKYTGLPAIIFISGIACLLAGAGLAHYRPLIRKHVRPIYVEKGIIEEIAIGLNSTEKQTF